MRNTPPAWGNYYALRCADFSYYKALCELIDNALDQGATRVRIVFSREGKRISLLVEDDGSGCANLERMLTHGDHLHTKTTQIGCFGVGFKNAVLWLGGPTQIKTWPRGQGRELNVRVDWDRIIRQKIADWDLPDPRETPAAPDARGMRIVCEHVDKRVPEGEDWSALVQRLSLAFTPALRDGRQIVVRSKKPGAADVPLRPYELPPLEKVIAQSGSVGSKTFTVRAGIVPEGTVNPRPGLCYARAHRVILHGTSLGCGSTNIARIAGWVELGQGWELTQNKETIGRDKERLAEAVHEVIKPVLVEAQRQQFSVHSSAFRMRVQETFARIVDAPRKAKRGKGSKEGTVTPSCSGAPHHNAANTQPGSGNVRQRGARKLDIQLMELPQTPRPTMVHFDPDGNCVRVAENHPVIALLQKADNHVAVVALALGTVAHHDATHDGKQRVLAVAVDGEEKFDGALCQILRDGSFIDEVAAAALAANLRVA